MDFKNTVIILTSNVGSEKLAVIEEQPNLSDLERRVAIERMMAENLTAHFRPEFPNRIDETLIFHRLSQATIRHILASRSRI